MNTHLYLYWEKLNFNRVAGDDDTSVSRKLGGGGAFHRIAWEARDLLDCKVFLGTRIMLTLNYELPRAIGTQAAFIILRELEKLGGAHHMNM